MFELSYPVKNFIENNVVLLEEGDVDLFFYHAMFALTTNHSEVLVNIVKDILNIDPEEYIKAALIEWAKDNIALQYRSNIQLSKFLQNVPRFGYDFMTFRNMFVEALKVAYPNKTVLPDRYGVEYIVEKQ